MPRRSSAMPTGRRATSTASNVAQRNCMQKHAVAFFRPSLPAQQHVQLQRLLQQDKHGSAQPARHGPCRWHHL